ncbi:MAG: hypothetical protein M0Z51_02885, partial [Propionibacterium sp.]|nr:hypothetical protein [Propionibacterium sp.]
MATTTAQRALIAASFVAVGVAAFVIAYLYLGGGSRAAGPSDVPSVLAPTATAPTDPIPAAALTSPATTAIPATTVSASDGSWPWGGASHGAPSSVGSLRLESNTMSSFTVAWDPAVDNTGIQNYRVLMNGFLGDTTGGTRATLGWLADRNPILIQVAAVDVDGNYGPWSALYVVPPPEPATTNPTSTAGPTSSAPTPSEPASPSSSVTTPSASADPAPSITPTASATPSASGTPTCGPSQIPSASAAPTASAPPTASATTTASATPTCGPSTTSDSIAPSPSTTPTASA